MRYVNFSLFAASMLVGTGSVVAAQDYYYNILVEQLACLREHAEQYLAVDKNPLFVDLSKCPVIQEGSLFGSLISEGPSLDVDVDKKYDTLLYLSKHQVSCLTSAKVDENVLSIKFIPSTCEISPLELSDS